MPAELVGACGSGLLAFALALALESAWLGRRGVPIPARSVVPGLSRSGGPLAEDIDMELPKALAQRAAALARSRPDGTSHPAAVVFAHPNLGNLCVALPVIDALVSKLGEGTVVVVPREYASVCRLLPSQPVVHGYARSKAGRWRPSGFIRDLRNALALRRRRFALALDVAGGVRSATLAWATGAATRIGLSTYPRAWMYTTRLDPGDYRHVAERYRTFLSFAPGVRASRLPLISASAQSFDRVRARLKSDGLGPAGRIVVMHPLAGYAFRCWPADRFAELARRLIDTHGARVVLIGAPSEREDLRRIRSSVDRDGRAAVFTSDLADLVALFELGALLVANESGPMHLAALTTLPIVAMYGPTNEERWGPIRTVDTTTLRGRVCHTACRWGRCVGQMDCVTGISVERVFDAASPYLETHRSAASHG